MTCFGDLCDEWQSKHLWHLLLHWSYVLVGRRLREITGAGVVDCVQSSDDANICTSTSKSSGLGAAGNGESQYLNRLRSEEVENSLLYLRRNRPRLLGGDYEVT